MGGVIESRNHYNILCKKSVCHSPLLSNHLYRAPVSSMCSPAQSGTPVWISALSTPSLALTLCQIVYVLVPNSLVLVFGLFIGFDPASSGKLLILPSHQVFACSSSAPLCLTSPRPGTSSFLKIIYLWNNFLKFFFFFLDTVR